MRKPYENAPVVDAFQNTKKIKGPIALGYLSSEEAERLSDRYDESVKSFRFRRAVRFGEMRGELNRFLETFEINDGADPREGQAFRLKHAGPLAELLVAAGWIVAD